MVHFLYMDKSDLENITKTCKGVNLEFGLLIGSSQQCGDKKENCVSQWCPIEHLGGEEVPTSFDVLEEDTILMHASQSVGMLPAGLHIIGAYVATSVPVTSHSASAKVLRGLIIALYQLTVATYSSHLKLPPLLTHMPVLFVCPKTLEYSCESLSCTSSRALPEEATLKLKKICWREVQFQYYLDETLPLDNDVKYDSLQDSFVGTIAPWAQRVEHSVVLAAGGVCRAEEDATIADAYPGEGVVKCYILERCAESTSDVTGRHVRLRGNMVAKGYLPQQFRVGSLRRAVTSDVCRSVCMRWALFCDTEREPSAGRQYTLPRRLFIRDARLCDYQLPSDTAADTCISIEQVLKLTVTEHCVEDHYESWPELTVPRDVAQSTLSQQTAVSSTQLMLASLVLFVAVILAFVYLNIPHRLFL